MKQEIQEFWRNKRVFITGHTGFRGSWLALTLQQAGAQVFGFAQPPSTSPHFFDVGNVGQGMTSTFSDIRDVQSLKSALEFAQAEVVFHLAGGGGLKESWSRTSDTYSTQVMGTVNLLEALRETASVRSVVILSSDKVYRKSTTNEPFKEEDPLGGNEPAAAAKACVELIVESYLQGVFAPEKYNKHKIAIATARMGAVIGGGDFAADSLIYQLAQARQAGLDLPLRNPESVRPWMHVSDAVSGLMTLAQALEEQGPKISGPWNFSGEDSNMESVGRVKQIFLGQAVTDSSSQKVSRHNSLSVLKAESKLKWQCRLSVEEAVADCARWYREFSAF